MPDYSTTPSDRHLLLQWILALLFTTVLYTPITFATQELDADDTGMKPVPIKSYLIEKKGRINWIDAHSQFNTGFEVLTAQHDVMNFGMGSDTRWLRFHLRSLLTENNKRYLLIDTPWIDHLNVFHVSESGALIGAQTVGDHEPRHRGNGPKPGHIVELHLAKGINEILLRVETADPMVLPIYLLTEEELDEHLSQYYYDYGFGYGYLLALIIFNALLYIGLKDTRFLYYAIYLGSFTFMNMSYTGLGQQWLWPNLFEWQRWAPPVTMNVFAIAGLIFALNLLELQKFSKTLVQVVKAFIFFQILAQLVCWFFNFQAASVFIAFSCVGVYTLFMAGMGIKVYSHADSSTKYYMFAVALGLVGVSLTLATVWGAIPYTRLGYHAIEISMLLESTFLALALADRVRFVHMQQARAEHLANTDPLTGLNNRRAFYLFSSNLWGNYQRHLRPLSAIMMDIDHFKKLNDQYGHAVGDQVLIHISKLLARKARQGDVIARWGGEEFLILLPDTNKQEAKAIAERFSQLLQMSICKTQKLQLQVTASFGVSEVSPSDTSIDDLIERADGALYDAKLAGRNCIIST